MTRWIALFVAVVLFPWSPSRALAQKQPAAPQQAAQLQQALPGQVVKRETAEIFVGQKIADADAALRHHGKQPSLGKALATIGGPKDSEDLSFHLDEEHQFVVVHFQTTTQQVYGITACCIPNGNPGRLYHTHFSVRKITLHPDGSYSIQFEKPTPPKPAAERPQSVYPTFNGNNPFPPNSVRGGRY